MSVLAIVAFPLPAWTTLGAPLANHLWQSTLFAGIAGLLALALRKNRAHVRYGLWFAASVKFLFPFSLLVALGSRMGAFARPANRPHGLSFVVQQIGQPFATEAEQVGFHGCKLGAEHHSGLHFLPPGGVGHAKAHSLGYGGMPKEHLVYFARGDLLATAVD